MTPLLNGRGSKSEHHVQCNGKRLVRIRYGFVTDQISICNRSVITIRYTSFDKSTATDPIRYLSIGSVEQSVTDEFLISSGFFFWLCTGNYGTVRSRVAKHVSAILNVT